MTLLLGLACALLWAPVLALLALYVAPIVVIACALVVLAVILVGVSLAEAASW
jgi:hypothetical protein